MLKKNKKTKFMHVQLSNPVSVAASQFTLSISGVF